MSASKKKIEFQRKKKEENFRLHFVVTIAGEKGGEGG